MDCFVKNESWVNAILAIWGTKSNIADIIWQFYWCRLIECMNCFVKYESLVPAPFGYVEKETEFISTKYKQGANTIKNLTILFALGWMCVVSNFVKI